MISLSDVASFMTADQYNALVSAIGQTATAPALKFTLEQYAPKWVARPAVYGSNLTDLDVSLGISSEVSALVATYLVSGQLGLAVLRSEDSADQTWSSFGNWTIAGGAVSPSACIAGAEPGVTILVCTDGQGAAIYSAQWLTAESYGGFLDSSYAIISGANGSIKKTAVVGTNSVHIAILTNSQNIRLGYVDTTGGQANYTWKWSDIYWPWQVRSFDAIRTSLGYDVIAMVTDLPPIVDSTTDGLHMVTTEQRVQGIVIWKYDYINNVWSDYRVFDIADNQDGIARANVKLTTDGSDYYMTYARQYQNQFGLAITKSGNGIDWENPIFYTGLGTKSAITDIYPMPLVRNGDYMYLIGGDQVQRSYATRYMGTPKASLTEDLTSYVLSATGQIGAGRSATIVLSNPNGELTATNRLLANSPALTVRGRLELGYWCSVNSVMQPVTVPVIIGDVSQWDEDISMPVRHLTLSLKDATNLPSMVGVSEAVEWWSLTFNGDNFAPMIANDTVGTSGLGKLAPQTGTWTGGNSTLMNCGLHMQGNGQEGLALLADNNLNNELSGTMSGEVAFYATSGTGIVNTPAGTTVADTIVGGEYAGFAFKVRDIHNLYYLEYVPNASNLSFKLYRRIGTTTTASDGTQTTTHTNTLLASATVAFVSSYSTYYSGRITVEWKASLIRVYSYFPLTGNAATKIIEYEAYGQGDRDFSLLTAPRENGTTGHPLTGGYTGYMAYTKHDGTKECAPNGDAQAGTIANWDIQNIGGGGSVTNVTTKNRVADDPLASTRSIKVITDHAYDNPGVFYNTSDYIADLALPSKSHIAISAWLYIESGDVDTTGSGNEATIMCNGLMWYEGDVKAASKSGKSYVSAMNQWEEFTWELDTINGKVVKNIQIQFLDARGTSYRTLPTVFYIADLHISQTVPMSYIYFGNVDYCNGLPVYSAHDAYQSLYAYSGQHYISRTASISDDFSANPDPQFLTGGSAISTSGGHYSGVGPAYSASQITLPTLIQAVSLSTSGTIGIASLDVSGNPTWLARFVWTTTEVRIEVNDGHSFTRRLPKTIGNGNLRIAITTQRDEGYLFDNDQSGVTDWLTVAVYYDDNLTICATAPLYSTYAYGYVAYIGGVSSTPITLDSFRIDELHRIMPVFTVDPGENVSNGISRIVGASHALAQARYTDKEWVKIGRPCIDPPTSGNCAWVIPNPRNIHSGSSISAQVPDHVRLVGAWTEFDVFDSVGMQNTWRHYFQRHDDPNLMTQDEMKFEQSYILRDLWMAKKRQATAIQFNPLLEYGDYVQYNGSYVIVDGIDFSLGQAPGNAIVLNSSIAMNMQGGY